jgi:glycosyltransferase involved in cell wall biosynthesis
MSDKHFADVPDASDAPSAALRATETPQPTQHTSANRPVSNLTDLLCFSHLRWDFVYQRPQHLLSRAAQQKRVFFWEEPVWQEAEVPSLRLRKEGPSLWVVTPHLPHGSDAVRAQRDLLDAFVKEHQLRHYVSWYYTPMSLIFSDHLRPSLTVYDCMDELSAFRGAPPELIRWEKELFDRADLVFTGGQSLYEAKRTRHPHVHAFPSSIDTRHFNRARQQPEDPADQRPIPGPRFGFFGVIDERFDVELLRELAQRRPEWHFILLGPVVKISPESLPQGPNLHYLGMKSYAQLPAYVGHWQAGLLPFARNESTEFISPTKTPEYLAAGLPVVSTPIRDVVRPYGAEGLVEIAGTADAFEEALETIITCPKAVEWQTRVDQFLSRTSWDLTWDHMDRLMQEHAHRPVPFTFNQ